MRLRFLYFVLLLSSITIEAQVIPPETIVAFYYTGGDYRRGDKLSGAHEEKDSIVLHPISYGVDRHFYVADSTFHTHQIYPFRDGAFQNNINTQPKIMNHFGVQIKQKRILALLSLLDTAYYQPYIRIGSLKRSPEDTIFTKNVHLIDATHIPSDFSLAYYGLDTKFFKCLCKYYYQKFENELDQQFELDEEGSHDLYPNLSYTCNERNRKERLLTFLIERQLEARHRIVSSYTNYIVIILKFKNYDIVLRQDYPTPFKTEWQVLDTRTGTATYLINPKINTIIAELFPKAYSRVPDLTNYNNLKDIFELYLDSTILR